MRAKYFFTTEIDDLIRKTYRTKTKKGAVTALAEHLEMPTWRVTERAREIGALEPRIKELPWSEKELHILEQRAHLTAERIRIALKEAGYTRTVTAIQVKHKRHRLSANMKGMSAQECAECFGVHPKTVVSWIMQGLLRAGRRGTDRTDAQGGDEWFIKPKYLRAFVIENIGIIDIRKVEKFWFVDLLVRIDHGTSVP